MIRKIIRIGQPGKFVIENTAMDAFQEVLCAEVVDAFQGQSVRITVERHVPERLNMKVVGYWYAEIVAKVRFGLNRHGDMLSDTYTELWIYQHLQEITKESVSFALLQRFISSVMVDTQTGKIEQVVPVLASIPDNQLCRLFDPIIAWAATYLDVQINYPNENYDG